MPDFTSLPAGFRYALTGLLFIAVTAQFALVIYKFISTRKAFYCAFDGICFAVLVVFASYVSGSSSGNNVFYAVKLPYALVPALSLAVICYASAMTVSEYKKNKNRLTPSSVKQALDNLNSGICFADSSGRIVLINNRMAEFALTANGNYPRMLSELTDIFGEGTQYVSSDGRKWYIKSTPLTDSSLKGFTQTTAVDVTELSEANAQLEKENAQLKETNAEIQLMLERLADRIREQETLNLKIQIHNDIGLSLIKILKVINSNGEGDVDSQLSLLQNAVGYFSITHNSDDNRTLDELAVKSDNMGVKLVVTGSAGLSESQQRIIGFAADECITNCIKHANADKLFVEFSENDEFVTARFTNNGNPPVGKITEGGGLSSLRRKTEEAGGEMKLYSTPEFILEIRFRKESKND